MLLLSRQTSQITRKASSLGWCADETKTTLDLGKSFGICSLIPMGIDLPPAAEEFGQQVNRTKSKIGCPSSGSYRMCTSDVCDVNILWAPFEIADHHKREWKRNGINNVGRDCSYPSRGCERSAVRFIRSGVAIHTFLSPAARQKSWEERLVHTPF
jgi:hypothetical protein